MTGQDLTAGAQHQLVPPVDVAPGDTALAVPGEQLDSVVSEGFSNLNIPQFHDCGVCRTPAAHPDTPPKSQGPAFPCIPGSPLLPTTALPPPCPWEVTSVTRCRPALQQEKGLACHHRRHIVTGHEDNATCFIPKMTWETPFSCSFTKFWGPSQPGWPRTEGSTS